jgi:hypothetical protein
MAWRAIDRLFAGVPAQGGDRASWTAQADWGARPAHHTSCAGMHTAELRFPLDGKIRQATLPKLAHLLFNFFFIQRPEQSWMLALRLEAESGYVQEQLAAATLAKLSFSSGTTGWPCCRNTRPGCSACPACRIACGPSWAQSFYTRRTGWGWQEAGAWPPHWDWTRFKEICAH